MFPSLRDGGYGFGSLFWLYLSCSAKLQVGTDLLASFGTVRTSLSSRIG